MSEHPLFGTKGGYLKWLAAILVIGFLLSKCDSKRDETEHYSNRSPYNSSSEKTYNYDDRDKELTAFVFAEQYVKEHIASPSTAVFGEMADSKIYKLEDNYYYISGFLDAQNRYGATVRMNYNCNIRLKGDNAEGSNIYVRER